MESVVQVHGLTKSYPVKRSSARRQERRVVLRDVDFAVEAGETVGVVGESGSGKSTLVRCILRLTDIDSGQLIAEGWSYGGLPERSLGKLRTHAQMVFQDPYGSLDDRWTVERIISEPLRVHHKLRPSERRKIVHEHLRMVGLEPATFAERYPAQLSGGQRQRVAIARAIILSPRLVVLDEAVAALDVVTQGDVLNLLNGLQQRAELAYVFISHDIAVVSNVADRIVVLFDGQVVEEGSRDAVIGNPTHPYTRQLLDAVPGQGKLPEREETAPGSVGLPDDHAGCRFCRRCPLAIDHCAVEAPMLRETQPGHVVRCHLASDLDGGGAA